MNKKGKKKKRIILATSSPYRIQAFAMLGIPFQSESSNVDERFDGRPDDPEDLVMKLAELKARSVAENHKEGIVIGFDSVACRNADILEKPQSRDEMVKRLKRLSGREYQFYTGIFIIDISDGHRTFPRVVQTNIVMRHLSDSDINRYLDQDPRYKTYAQGYDPLQTYGSTFIEEIHGSYNNVLRGIPLETIVEMLQEIGYEI